MAILRAADQADYIFQVGDSAPEDFQVVRFKAQEGISQMYSVEVDLASTDPAVAIDQYLGKPAVLTIMSDQSRRWFHGVLVRIEQGSEGVRFTNYHALLVPAVWLLTLRHHCRIFQDMTVPDIITKVLNDAGMTSEKYRLALSKSYAKREYCVQYRETDFNFISRLMEEEGIFYFFEQSAESHVMVIGDSPDAHVPVPEVPECVFREATGMVPKEEFIYRFRFGQNVRIGAVTLRDFNFKQPSMNLQAQSAADGQAGLEFSDYPGGYDDPSPGKDLAKIRLEEFQATRKHGSGVSTCRRLTPGFRFTLKEHSRDDFNVEYLLIRTSHQGAQPQLLGQEGGAGPSGDEPLYQNNFECIPADVPFRPARRTPCPVVEGTQTAIVVGPAGEEIYTDEYGRVKVQFHWDRQGKYDENSSCWIRVASGWAGGQYGSIFLPRVGQEVIVDFLEGDPDRPIVVGRIFNGDLMPPYKLPDEKTKSVIRTHSSKGGAGANELRFEDKKDSEQILIHAQKDFHLRVTNDLVENVENDRHVTVAANEFVLVKQKKHTEVKLDLSEKVGGKKSLEVAADVAEDFKANHSEEVGNNFYLKAGQNVVIEAGVAVTLKAGGNFLKIDPSGITIFGTMVKINSGGAAGSGTTAALSAPEGTADADDVEPGKDVTYSGTDQITTGTTPDDIGGLGAGEDDQAETTWIEIELVDEAGQPVDGEAYEITAPDGTTIRRGTLDSNGQAHVGLQEPGNCQISFPNLDAEAWERS